MTRLRTGSERLPRIARAAATLLNAIACSAFAGEPPAVVYRVDLKPPSRVYWEGLPAPGNNGDVQAHANGRICTASGQPSSNFVWTSSDAAWAQRRTAQVLSMQPIGGSVTVYTIRAASNFFALPREMQGAAEVPNEPLAEPDPATWLAVGGVLPAQIYSANTYVRTDTSPLSFRAEASINARFAWANTRANEGAYPPEISNRAAALPWRHAWREREAEDALCPGPTAL